MAPKTIDRIAMKNGDVMYGCVEVEEMSLKFSARGEAIYVSKKSILTIELRDGPDMTKDIMTFQDESTFSGFIQETVISMVLDGEARNVDMSDVLRIEFGIEDDRP